MIITNRVVPVVAAAEVGNAAPPKVPGEPDEEFEDVVSASEGAADGGGARSSKGNGATTSRYRAGAAGKTASASSGKPGPPSPRVPRSYTYEYCGLVMIVVYLVLYFHGRKQNVLLAQAWEDRFRDLFMSQFAQVGPAPLTNDQLKSMSLLFKESQSTFLLYATGRRLCRSVLVTLQLRKRQDLLWLLWDVIYPQQDTVTVEVVRNTDDVEPLVLAVAKKKEHRQVRSQHQDLNDFTGNLNSDPGLPKSLTIMTDCPSAVSDVLSTPILKDLSKYEHLVQLIHITDQNSNAIIGCNGIPKNVARFRFSVPPDPQAIGELSKLMEMSLYFIDHLALDVKLSQQARNRAISVRKEMEQRKYRKLHELRQEQIQRKKFEKLERERAEYEQLTHDQKLKRDAKEDRKKAKGATNRFRVKLAK